MPEELFRKLKKYIKKEWKIAFISAVIIGFLTHMYVFTNMLPNHDGLINIYSSQLKFNVGRFFLSPFSGISSFFDLPWINGTLSVLYLALMVVVLTEIFELRKTIAIILCAGIVMTFPTVAATFSYMFTADGYMAGFLLAVLAILITKKYKYGFLPASLIFYLSVGIYQANLPIVLSLATIWFIRELVFNQTKLKSLFLSLIRFASMTAIGMGLYGATFILYQKVFGVKMSAYQGFNQIGLNSISIHDQLLKIISSFENYLFRGFFFDYPVNLFEALNLLLFILILIALGITITSNKVYKSPVRISLIILSFMFLPVFEFILYFFSPGITYHMLMIMGLIAIYLLPIVIYDRLELPRRTVKCFSWGTVCILFLIIYNFAIISNIAYFSMTLKFEKSYALVNRILDRIEQTEGYENASKLAVIGRPIIKTELATKTLKDKIPNMTGAMWDIFVEKPYHFESMLANYFGETLTCIDDEQLKTIGESDLVKKMHGWPAKDSILIEGAIVIIKFSQ